MAPIFISPRAISSFNLAGSIMSVVGSLFVIMAHGYLMLRYKQKQDSVRTKLIMCLAIADFLNSLNNSTSGIAAKQGWALTGPWCAVNGFVGQVTVLASDLTVFAIAVATVAAVRMPLAWRRKRFWMQQYSVGVVVGLWLYPLGTGLIAQFTVGYVKSAANWCWINPTPAYVRYVLTHGIRIAIIFSIFGMYSWMYFALKTQVSRHKSEVPTASAMGVAKSTDAAGGEGGGGAHAPPSATVLQTSEAASPDGETAGAGPQADNATTLARKPSEKPAASQTESTAGQAGAAKDPLYRVMRMMIIFPSVYTVLWIPGLVTRFYNLATGGSLPILDLLQGMTQWIGFGNAVVFGFNEEVKGGLRDAFGKITHRRNADLENSL